MFRIFPRVCAVLVIGLLFGCNQVSQYTLSEQSINKYLATHTDKTSRSFNLSGLVNADLSLNNLNAKIGRDTPNKVTLSGNAVFAISSILGNQDANLQLTINARPDFDPVKGAVYLKDLELADYDLKTTQGAVKNVKTFIPLLNSALQLYFNDQPVYILNPANSALEATAQKLAKGIKVEEGKLVFDFIK
ncbi:lipoprotein [Jinshanibacter sp. LJY008]|uniref:Lipoprotein n=1 Tax=Limnobaculum eriocheiris TaxID=2897391 RepID=A0A9X1MZK9_9GAMM|nr:lipoprotein [Limnobaculum eriocheiris]MCD1127525.1 lipoprotein [Limnobaculum eriocheiris]